MLEFEENNDRTEQVAPATGGYVKLPINEYNELLRRADAADNAIKLRRRDYLAARPIELEIDKHWLHALAKSKLLEQYHAEELSKYKLVDSADDLIVLDVTVAQLHEPIRKKED